MSFSNSNSSSSIVTLEDEVSPPPLWFRAAAGAEKKDPSTKKNCICMPVWLWLILLTIIYTVLVVSLGITLDFWFFLYLFAPVPVLVVVLFPVTFASLSFYLFEIVFWTAEGGIFFCLLWFADFDVYGIPTTVMVDALSITSFGFTLVFLYLMSVSCGSRKK